MPSRSPLHLGATGANRLPPIYNIASVGVSGGVNWGHEEASWQVQDLNGDGIADGLASDGTIDLGTPMSVNMSYLPAFAGIIGDLQHSNRSSYSLGGNVGLLGGAAASAAVTHTWGEISDDRLLTDINGDGFTDYVFSDNGNLMVRYGKWDGTLAPAVSHPTPELGDLTLQGSRYEASKKKDMPIVAPLMRWIAPFDSATVGTATLTGAITKLAPGGDGVLVSIYRKPPGAPVQLYWSHDFAPANITPCTPAASGLCGSGLPLTSLVSGEEVYFLVDGKTDTKADEISWDALITYQASDPNQPDPNHPVLEPTGAPIYSFSQARDPRTTDFRLSGEPNGVWRAEAQGTVEATWTFSKFTTNDDVALQLVRTYKDTAGNTVIEKKPQGTYCGDCIVIPTSNTVLIDVLPGDQLAFEVLSDVPIDPQRVTWQPRVNYKKWYRYDPETNTTYGNDLLCGPNPTDPCVIKGDPDDAYSVPQQLAYQLAQVHFPPRNQLPIATPTKTFRATLSGTLHVGGQVTKTVNIPGGTAYIQGVNRLYKKVQLPSTTAPVDVSADVSLQPGDQVFLVITDLDSTQVTWDAWIGTQKGQVNFRTLDPYYQPGPGQVPPPNGNLMSGGYHQWSFGDWNTNAGFDPSLIKTPPDKPTTPPAYMFVLPNAQGTPSYPLL